MRITTRSIARFAMAALLAGIAYPSHAQDAVQQTTIEQKLKEQFTLTTVSADKNDIVTAGSVLVLHKDGLLMYETSSPMPPGNTYKNGKITQGWGGFGRDLMISMAAPDGETADSYAKRKFVAGEKFWITSCSLADDGVVLLFYSDPYNDVRYYGQLKILFPKGRTPSPDEVLRTIAEVVTTESAPQDAAPSAPATPNSQTFDAPLAPIVPPPPPPDAPPASPKIVALGQTKAQVMAILGQPQKVAKLGAKEIDYYPDLKVILVNGKVTDAR